MGRGRLPRVNLAGVLLWVTPAIWSSNYLIARAADGVISPHVLALGRWTVALLLMLPLVWKDRGIMLAAARSEWHQMLLLGALGMWICGAFVYIGGQTTSAGNIAILYAATPVGIAVVSRWLLNEAPSWRQQLAMAGALLGVLFIISKGHPSALLEARFAVGDLWIVAATASWVAYSVLQQHWPSQLQSSQRLACITVGGLVVLLPFTLAEIALNGGFEFSRTGVLLMLSAGVVPGFLAYQAYSFIVQELGATRAGLVMYLGPVYAVFIAWWLLGEAPQWFHAVGAALILPSIYFASFDRRTPQ
jgi:drug/metabolite transporter (DMT)-like permease